MCGTEILTSLKCPRIRVTHCILPGTIISCFAPGVKLTLWRVQQHGNLHAGQRHIRAELPCREPPDTGAQERQCGSQLWLRRRWKDGYGHRWGNDYAICGGLLRAGGAITRTYYYHAGKRVAMRQNSTLYWLLTDHLGSTAVAVAASGVLPGELRYKAWGETHYLNLCSFWYLTRYRIISP